MSACYLGLDLGGTKIAAGVVAGTGELLSAIRIPTAELRDGVDTFGNLVTLGRQAVEAAGSPPLSGAGVALPGPSDHREIRLLKAPTIPELEGLPMGQLLGLAFDCPVAGDNDANACALAESRFGAGRGRSHVVYCTVSTGIGGGVVVHGRLFRGAHGTSAELGHQIVSTEAAFLCDCGNRGCLETLASGRGIVARAIAASQGLPLPAQPDWIRLPVTAEILAAAARAGEPVARRVWEDTAYYLGIGLSNVINILDPDVIVLGGGVAVGAADLLLGRVRDTVSQRCMPRLGRPVDIEVAGLGTNAGMIGAACLAIAAESP